MLRYHKRLKRYSSGSQSGVTVSAGGRWPRSRDNTRRSSGGRRRDIFRQAFTAALLTGVLLIGSTAAEVEDGEMPLQPREDHAVIAVTVDGHVHTLDAWTGDIRGVFLDSGGPLVSSSTTVDVSSDEDSDSDNGVGGGAGENQSDDNDKQYPRNALREGLVVPGLDGVIYLLGADGRLSVLMSSALDLVLEPRMACLTVNADADGVVEDESCGLLIGEKTTQLFSLDILTGEAKRLGGESAKPDRQASEEGISSDGDGSEGGDWDEEGGSKEWTVDGGSRDWNEEPKLLLQRDEYVVRAFDAATSTELWFVTVAHFSALDLEGHGGPKALTRAKVAAGDRAGYAQAIRARISVEEDYGFSLANALPSLSEDEEDGFTGWGEDSWGSSESQSKGELGEDGGDASALFGDGCDDDISEEGGPVSGGGQTRRRNRFGSVHADRFPYLLYENNAYVVAMDPLDGSVLWRKELPSLAVSLYGIRGREWVDILPPPMSMLQPSPRYEHAPRSSPTFVPGASSDDEWLNRKFVGWSPNYVEPLLLLTGGDEDCGTVDEEDECPVNSRPSTYEVSNAVDSDGEVAGVGCVGDGGRSCGSFGDSKTSVRQKQEHGTENNPTTNPSTSMLPGLFRRPGAERIMGFLPYGSRYGPLHAQVGFLNGHFFVSSSLRKASLHASAEDSAAIMPTDRYPHPSLVSRRAVADAGVSNLRGLGTEDSGGDADVERPPSLLPPPVVKIPPHAAWSTDGSRGRTATRRDGNGVNLGSPKNEDVGGFLGDSFGYGGLGTEIGLGEWRQALLERVEREIEGRGSVEVHPEKEGLYMSWNFVAAVVGLVSVTVIGVALTAYKHGAKAMLNVTAIARKRGAMTRRNTAIVVVTGAAHNRRRSQRETGRISPPLASNPLQLQHGASMSAVPRMHTRPMVAGGGDARGDASRPDAVLQQARALPAVNIQRVHSLPVLGHAHSPTNHPDRRLPVVAWPALFGSNEIGVGSSSGGLARVVTEGAGKNGPQTPRVTESGGGGSGEDSPPREGGSAHMHADVGDPEIEGRNDIEEGSGTGSRSTGGGENKELLSAESPPEAAAVVAGGGASSTTSSRSPSWTSISSCEEHRPLNKGRDGLGSSEVVALTAMAASAADSGSSSGRGQRQRRIQPPERGARRRRHLSNDDGESVETLGDLRRMSGEHGTREDRVKQRRSERNNRASFDDRDDRGDSDNQRTPGDGARRRRRRGSDSPRGSHGFSGEELVLGAGLGGGDGDATVLGGDTEAVLVTNRRLRTEFVEGQKLGRGGFGTVFKCRNKLDGHDYAIKKIRLSSDPRWQPQLAKVLREVKIMSLLDHPNIVRYYQAWLERFTEEDEEQQRGAAPSAAASESWDVNTSSSRPIQTRNTGTSAATNRTLTSTNQGDLSRVGDGDNVGGYTGEHIPRSLLGRRVGGALQGRSDANNGVSGRMLDSTALLPRGHPSRISKILYEDQSVDGWTIDSRHEEDEVDDRGLGRGRGSGRGGIGGRCWGDVPAWSETEYSREGDDEGLDEDDDASLPGFVFDRAGTEDSAREDGNAGVEKVGGGEGADPSHDCSDRGQFGRDKVGESGGVKRVRPSGSVSATATAPVSSSAAYVDSESEGGEEANAVCDDAPRSVHCGVLEGEKNNNGVDGVDRGETGCDPSHSRRGREKDFVDSIVSCDRTTTPSPPTFPITNGYHQVNGRRVGEAEHAAIRAAKRLPNRRREGSSGASDCEGVASANEARVLEVERKRRPRGESWPLNTGVAAAASGKDDRGSPRVRQHETRGHIRPSAAEKALGASRRREFRKGAWERGRGRGRSRGGRPRKVYDLWLYIQMQYCSHNNLQYFLEENPDRRSQTRVDMPQVMHIFLQIAKGLQYVHACGLIHRDLKPANCFLMAEGTVKIGDFGLSRYVLPADGINGRVAAAADVTPVALNRKQGSFTWESDRLLGEGVGGDDASITGGVGTYLYASPEQMSGKGYDEKTDVYSLGMLLFEMCHPPFGTKMERTVVLTNAHRLVFPEGDAWGPPKGQEAMKSLCRSMLQEDSAIRPSATEIVRQVELMQGKHMLLQLDKKPPGSYGADDGGSPDVAVVLRVEAVEQDGLLHRVVDRIRALCKGQAGHNATAGGIGGDSATDGGGGARLEQYGLRGHTGSAVMEFLVAGAGREEREAIVEALEGLPEVKSVREFPANG